MKGINYKPRWDLSVFYPSLEAWDEDLKILPAHIEMLASYNGKLSDFDSFRALYVYQYATSYSAS
ncbi:MAG: hypothetical protein ABH890_01640 [Bacillota bacterium]